MADLVFCVEKLMMRSEEEGGKENNWLVEGDCRADLLLNIVVGERLALFY